MKALFLTALILAGMLWPASALAVDCNSFWDGYGSFPLVVAPDGHLATLLPINDKYRLMVVDTGGANSELSTEVANELDLTAKSVPEGLQVDVLGHHTTDYVVVPILKFGRVAFKDVPFALFTSGNKNATQADGVLGPDILGSFDVDFDFRISEMRIYAKNHCPGKIPYWSPMDASAPFETDSSGHVILSMTLDGKPVRAVLDTGAPRSAMNMEVANRLFGLSPGVKGVEENGYLNDDPSQKIYQHRFVSLALDGLEVKNPVIDLLPDNIVKATNGNAHLPDVILGLRDLAELHLYIAYQEKVIYLTSAGAEYPNAEAGRQQVWIAEAKARAEHKTTWTIPIQELADNSPPPLRPPFPPGLTAPVAVDAHDCKYQFGYPAAAYFVGAEGATDLSFVVTTDGTVRDVNVTRSSGNAALDYESINCVLPWKFEPATLNGQPVDVVQTTTRVWKLP